MPRTNKKDEDLFQDSTMSFSQHLDELRLCLIRAMIWLAVGVGLGFFCGTWAVNFIQMPLQESLNHFYENKALLQLQNMSEELRLKGYPDDIALLPQKGLIPELYRLLPQDAQKIVSAGTGKPLAEKPIRGPSLSDVDNFNEFKGTGLKPIEIFLIRNIKDDPRVRVKALSAQEMFSIWLKASFVVGLLLSSPGIFWSIWTFIGAGLYPHERRHVYVFLPISLGLFIAGMLLAFFVVFQFVLDFLFMFNRMLSVDPDPRISEWLNFALLLPIGFGLSFQLPLVMFFLERIGVFTIKTYLDKWRISVLVIVVLAIFLTPGDPYSMVLMALPLVILYFIGILMCKIFPRKKSIFDFDDEDLVPV
ncbi:MAG: twin-arginine translocase subunit TatC [Planctomycetaceae bacterium]|nr:twin-arginine translocase subunit TatC [Planctomycetaceae bacterium]